ECFFVFFSSRRRHTRFSRDWSSDVCSSDLSLGRSCCEGQRHLWKHRGLEYSLRPEQWHSLTLKLKTCRQQVTREDLTMKCGLISQELERRSTNSRIAGRRLICHRRVTIARAG